MASIEIPKLNLRKSEYYLSSQSSSRPINKTTTSFKFGTGKKFRKLSDTPRDYSMGVTVENKTTRSLSQNPIFLSELENIEKDPEFMKTLPNFSISRKINKHSFPYKKMSPRIMATSLNDWCKEILSKTKESGFTKGIEILLKSLNAAYSQLSSEISEKCKEQGALMINLWETLMKIVDTVLNSLMSQKLNTERSSTQQLTEIHKIYQQKLDSFNTERELAIKEAMVMKEEAEQVTANNNYLSKKIAKLSQELFGSKKKQSAMKAEISDLYDELVKEKGKTRGLESQLAELESESKRKSFIDVSQRFSKRTSIAYNKNLEVPRSGRQRQSNILELPVFNIQESVEQKVDQEEAKQEVVFIDNQGITYAIKDAEVNTEAPPREEIAVSTFDLYLLAEKEVMAVAETIDVSVLAIIEPNTRESSMQTENLMIEGSQKVFSRQEYNDIFQLLDFVSGSKKEEEINLDVSEFSDSSNDSVSIDFSISANSISSPLKNNKSNKLESNLSSFSDDKEKVQRKLEKSPSIFKRNYEKDQGSAKKLSKIMESVPMIENNPEGMTISLTIPESNLKPQKLKKSATLAISTETVKNNIKKLSTINKRQSDLITKLTEMLIRTSLLQEKDVLTYESAKNLVEKGKRLHRKSIFATEKIKSTVQQFHHENKNLRINLQEEKISHAESKAEATRNASKLDSLWREYESLSNDLEEKTPKANNQLAPVKPQKKKRSISGRKSTGSRNHSPINSSRELNVSMTSSSKIAFVKPFNFSQRKVKIQRTTSVNADNANRILHKRVSSTKPISKSNLPKSNVLKIIKEIYAEKLRQLKGNEKENPLHVVTYDFFLNRYGFRQLSESKLNTFLEACSFHRGDKKIWLFGRLFGIYDPLDYDDFEFFMSAHTVLDSGPIPMVKTIETANRLCKNYSKEKLEEIADSRGIIESEDFLFFIMETRIRQNDEAILRLKQVYLAGDVDNDQSIDFFEFMMLFRYMEPSLFSFIRASSLFYSKIDLFDEEENDGSMTFGVFAKTSHEFKIFSLASQEEFYNGELRIGQAGDISDLRGDWKSISGSMKSIFMKTGSFDKFHLKMLQKIDSFFKENEKAEESDEKTIWFIYRFLSEECASCLVSFTIKDLFPIEILDFEEESNEVLLKQIKVGKFREDWSSRLNSLATEN